MQKPTTTEVLREIQRLIAIRPAVPEESMFGDNNHAVIDAQILILQECDFETEVGVQFGHGASHIYQAAMDAWYWKIGEGDEGTPASSWEDVYGEEDE